MIVPLDANGGWRFCHPLIHDAAYRSLLATDRRALHGRVADRMEATTPPAAVGVIARHRAAAGDAERAIPLLIAAAEQAEVLGARAEAAAYFTSAADMTAGLDADALRARAMDAHVAAPVGGR